MGYVLYEKWARPAFFYTRNQPGAMREQPEVIRQVESIITPSIEAMGYHVVLVRMTGGSQRTLQIMAEHPGDACMMTVDDCAAISRTVSALLDVEDPISGAYHLEVSSPGIDRPLILPPDYARYAGFEAKIETTVPINGQRRFRGIIKAADATEVVIVHGNADVKLSFDSILSAKLVLSDALIDYTQKMFNLNAPETAPAQLKGV